MRAHLCDLLSDLDIDSIEAKNGVEAIDILGSQKVDLILTDLVMPEMDGFELCEEIRRQPALRELPTIVTSSHRDASYVIRALRRGADDYLTKPATPSSFRTVIERALSHV